MAIEFGDRVYTFGEGSDAIALRMADLSVDVVATAVSRAFNHVLSNEASSKVTAARKKGAVSDEMAADILAKARAAYIAAITAGTWGSGADGRSTRTPGVDRESQIFANLLNGDVRKAAAKWPGFTAVDGKKDVWGYNGEELTLAALAEKYLSNAKLGGERRADLEKRAATQYAREMEDAAARKARAKVEADVEAGLEGF